METGIGGSSSVLGGAGYIRVYVVSEHYFMIMESLLPFLYLQNNFIFPFFLLVFRIFPGAF